MDSARAPAVYKGYINDKGAFRSLRMVAPARHTLAHCIAGLAV